MDELLAEFISETQETLEALAGEVVAWEAQPDDKPRLDAIFRFFHTVKGSCGFLNLPRFEKLAHAAEDVLSDIRAGNRSADPATVNAVLAIMDRIGELAEAVSSGASLPMENDDLLINALQRALDSSKNAPEAAEPSPEVQQSNGRNAALRTIRLPLSLIDQLMNGVSDMVLARNEMSRQLRERMSDPELESAFERLSTCVADMRDAISKTRMQRVERLFAAIPRMVRDIGRDLGKRIELTLEGGDVEMDREMVEMVADPLTHIVRNCIDHGIESPHERLALGKSEAGCLRISARQSGNQIVIEIADDGRGIDSARLLDKALMAGTIDKDRAARMTEAERLELIFMPGLSTAERVTSISGRGVGMDVVRANIERIGGVIGLDNQPGRGLKITLRVPLTLTIIPGLIVKAGGLHFAIPRATVIEILHDNNEMLSIDRVGGASIATIRRVRHSMIDLEDVLGLPRAAAVGPRTIMVVRAANGIPYALGVESVENHEELVIRPASPLIMSSGMYAGMTLPDNGRPMLLLDAGGLANAAQLPGDLDERPADHAVSEDQRIEMMSALRFEERSGEERLLRLSLVERVEDIPTSAFGWSKGKGFVQLDGHLITVLGDAVDAGQDCVTCLRLRDGDQEFCYPVARVVDIIDVPAQPDMKLSSGKLLGVTVVDGAHLEVIDPFGLFARARRDEIEEGGEIRCILADGEDPWMQEILLPMLRQAGHQVVLGLPDPESQRGTDIILSMDPDRAQGEGMAGMLVQLRGTPRPRGERDPSIYKYDRDGLLEAIEQAAGKMVV